jgi:hypothetical protein
LHQPPFPRIKCVGSPRQFQDNLVSRSLNQTNPRGRIGLKLSHLLQKMQVREAAGKEERNLNKSFKPNDTIPLSVTVLTCVHPTLRTNDATLRLDLKIVQKNKNLLKWQKGNTSCMEASNGSTGNTASSSMDPPSIPYTAIRFEYLARIDPNIYNNVYVWYNSALCSLL